MNIVKWIFLLCITLPLAFPASANNKQAGLIISTKGEVTATKDNRSRDLKRRSKIFKDEIIRTSDSASARVRCTNRSIISLGADTVFNSNNCLSAQAKKTEDKIKSFLKTRSATLVSSRSTQTAQAPIALESGSSGTELSINNGNTGIGLVSGVLTSNNPFRRILQYEIFGDSTFYMIEFPDSFPAIITVNGSPAYITFNPDTTSGTIFSGYPPSIFGAGTGSGFGVGFAQNTTGAFANSPTQNLQGSTANTIEEPELSMENN